MSLVSLKHLSCITALSLAFGAQATTTFDPSTNALKIDAILLDGSIYRDVSVTINSYTLNSIGSGAPVNNSFDPQSNLLTLGAVTVQGTAYNNVTVGVNSYTLKDATPAGAAVACVAPQTLVAGINACVTPMGQKVYGAKTVPGLCNSVSQACWTNSVANGTIKWIATSAVSTGATPVANSTRPIVFAFYTNYIAAASNTGPLWWQVSPVYADTGKLALPAYPGQSAASNPNITPTPGGGEVLEIDWVVGTEQGVITHFKSSGQCYLVKWDLARNGWTSFNMTAQTNVACP